MVEFGRNFFQISTRHVFRHTALEMTVDMRGLTICSSSSRILVETSRRTDHIVSCRHKPRAYGAKGLNHL